MDNIFEQLIQSKIDTNKKNAINKDAIKDEIEAKIQNKCKCHSFKQLNIY